MLVSGYWRRLVDLWVGCARVSYFRWFRTEDVWVHPWVDDYLRRLREKQRKASEEQSE